MTDRLIAVRLTEDELLAVKEALADYDPKPCVEHDHTERYIHGTEGTAFSGHTDGDGWTKIETMALRAAQIAVRDAVSGIDPR